MTKGKPEKSKPKLLEQMRREARVHRLSLRTERTYVGWARR
jgi:hypothetical protein